MLDKFGASTIEAALRRPDSNTASHLSHFVRSFGKPDYQQDFAIFRRELVERLLHVRHGVRTPAHVDLDLARDHSVAVLHFTRALAVMPEISAP
jgi:hypothetical protein